MTRRLEMEKVEPHLFVVFGATGDLSRRKLLPAFHRLMKDRLGESVVLGVAGSVLTDEEFRARSLKALVEAGVRDEDAQRWCGRALHYQPIGEGFDALVERIEKIEKDESLPGNRVFYLALPPEAFDETVTRLGESGLSRAPGWVRIVVEKPFGEDLASSQKATASLARWFDETQIFRIDHYLGKETVQNLLVFRFANLLFESSWHRDRIAAVQVTVAEDGGVGTRGRYYDKSGAVRDIMQNHLTQLLALIAMEPPVRLGANEIRDEKVKLLRAIWPVDPDSAVLGQYGPGEVGGVPVPGYAEEVGNPGQPHADLRGGDLHHRHLAVAGRPLLPPHRQETAKTGHRDRCDLPPPAGLPVRRIGGVPGPRQRPQDHPPTRRGLRIALRREAAR